MGLKKSGTPRQGQNYFGTANFGVDNQALRNAGVTNGQNPPKNVMPHFKTHSANKKLHGKPMAK